MSRLIALLWLLLAWPAAAQPALTEYTGFDEFERTPVRPRVIVLLFSQPECGFCDQVRNDFLLPLTHQQRPELAIRELKVPGFGAVRSADGQLLEPAAFARRYGIRFYPSVLMLDRRGQALTEPLIGISSADFYGYYLDQAIEQALTRTVE